MNLDQARRSFLYRTLTGVGGLALLDLLNRDLIASPGTTSASGLNPLAPKQSHHRPKAQSCIFVTRLRGVRQMDTFDARLALDKFDNTVMDWSKEKATGQANLFAKPRLILKSPWTFKKYGQCGMDVSELFPHLATCVDDM